MDGFYISTVMLMKGPYTYLKKTKTREKFKIM